MPRATYDYTGRVGIKPPHREDANEPARNERAHQPDGKPTTANGRAKTPVSAPRPTRQPRRRGYYA